MTMHKSFLHLSLIVCVEAFAAFGEISERDMSRGEIPTRNKTRLSRW